MTIALRTKQIPSWVWSVSGALLGFLVLWIALGNLIANGRVQPIEAAQASLLKQFPDTDNYSARQISAQWKKLGLTPALTAKKDGSGVKLQTALEHYIHDQAVATEDKTIEPPKELRQFFGRHEEEIVALRQWIMQEEAPVWGVNIKAIAQDFSSIKTQSWLVHLNRVLLYDALHKNRNDYYQASFDSVMVAEKLVQFLRARPDLASHLLVATLAEEQAGVLRHLRYLPPDWDTAIPPRARDGMVKALRTENLTVARTTVNLANGRNSEPSTFNTLKIWVTRPYSLMPVVNHWQQQGNFLQSLLTQDVCQQSGSDGAVNSWRQAGFQDLRWEFTRKVQQVRTVIDRSGKLPEQVKGIEKSGVCPGLKWKYQAVNGKGELAIANPPSWLKEFEQKHGKTEYHFKLD